MLTFLGGISKIKGQTASKQWHVLEHLPFFFLNAAPLLVLGPDKELVLAERLVPYFNSNTEK